MKLTLNINDHRADFFLELIRTFDFISIENEAIETLSPAHKALLDKCLVDYHAKDKKVLSWEEVQQKMAEVI